MGDINLFAKTNFRNQERSFGIKTDDRRRHMYVIGKTGMGKSNMLENMAIQDIQAGRGMCYVDPHGEGAEKMLRAIPANRINDVVYFNPADKEFPIAFNILESVEEDKKHLVASGMMGVFKKIWPDVWSPRMEYILNNTILALLDYPGSTMLGVNRMMSDKDYRKRVYPKIKDPVVKSFWLNEFDKWEDKFRKEAVAAIQNKVGQFLSSFVIRHIVGQPKSSIDMRDIMDNEKILIVNLSKGRIGEDAMRLLGGMIVTKIQLAAMGRVEIPENERKDFFLYVDEFQNFATESFANILSEARKYRLALILAHQYVNQLIFDGNTTVRDAIFGNVGTIVSFRVGAEDAEALEKEFDPVFLMNDIVNLSKYQMYLKLMIDGIAGDAFSATSLPPISLADTENNEGKAIAVSRERYGKSRKEVEEKIARWSGMFDFEEFENEGGGEKVDTEKPKEKNIIIPNPQAKKSRLNNVERDSNSIKNEAVIKAVIPVEKIINTEIKEEKKMYDAVCSNCDEKIQVPFAPDPKRPTFCKECLKEYQRARAVNQKEKEEKQSYVAKREITPKYSRDEERQQNSKPDVIVSCDKPMSLSQMSHIAPKKFKSLRKKSEVNLADVRNLINQTKNN
ncbi:MAG: type IV secretion system DNA-binding domain-containing protein [bacterium]|nr:type IV secretion system DNA-binding domain-containing protein [bacterium]